MRARLHIVSAVVAAGSLAPCVQAAVVDADPSNYQSVVLGLAAGDTLRLAPGNYTQGLSLAGKAGTAAHPIVVSGPKDQSAVFASRACCNTVQLEDTSYVQLMNLTLDAGTRDGASGVSSRGNSHHITLENLMIVGHGGSAQTLGISTDGTASDWTMRNLAVSSAEQTSNALAAATPTVTLSASPSNVSAGSTAVLTWSSTDTTGCSASGGWSGTKGPSGSETVGPVQSTTDYQLTCLGGGGNAGATARVTVGGSSSPPPSDPTPTPPPSNPDPTPPPTSPSPPAMESNSGGGGSIDVALIVLLTLYAFARKALQVVRAD